MNLLTDSLLALPNGFRSFAAMLVYIVQLVWKLSTKLEELPRNGFLLGLVADSEGGHDLRGFLGLPMRRS